MPSTGNIFDVADHEGMVGDEGVSGGVDGHAEGIASRSPRLGNTEAVTLKGGVPPTGMASVKRTPNSQSIGLNPASAAGSEYQASPADSQFQTISQKQRIDAEMRLIFRSSISTTLDPADDPRFA